MAKTNLDLVTFADDTFKVLVNKFLDKNKQYAGKVDPLANFTNGAKLRYGDDKVWSQFETAKGYALKHIAHVYGEGSNIDTPKLDESLVDIAIYSVIMLYMIKLNELEKQYEQV